MRKQPSTPDPEAGGDQPACGGQYGGIRCSGDDQDNDGCSNNGESSEVQHAGVCAWRRVFVEVIECHAHIVGLSINGSNVGLQRFPTFEWDRRMPRPLRFPNLPDGPHRELVLFLHTLHQQAGKPATRVIAAGIVAASRGEVQCSHTTIHALLTGSKLPTNGDLLFELVKFLNDRNRHRRADEEALLDELDTLWRPATRRYMLELPTTVSVPVDSGIGGGSRSRVAQELAKAPLAHGSAVFPNPANSRAILLACDSFTADPDLPSLPAAGPSMFDLAGLLEVGGVFGRTEPLLNPTTNQLLAAIQDAADQTTDTLLLYYCGHGVLSRTGELHLATPDTSVRFPHSGAAYSVVRDLLSGSPSIRATVILDCCFSGRAAEAMGPLDGMTDIPSTYVLSATSRNSAALAPAGARYTAFTSAIIDTLRDGAPPDQPVVTVHDLYRGTRRLLEQRDAPRPSNRWTGPSEIPIIRNPNYIEGLPS
ncbi:caspase family protein [Nocardia aurantiaca]|uniref:Peptidase C14 caspase domain-containing protein n=1 Tax=Nocardia aurantiaca TaxID=2675850 RepID=A0A6I3KU18_9NOCA|nr:caspase family protein [Nocardia aurantiaca]MTE12861.1 hypothetical protein [Nocardia aurantiaca]